MFYSFSYSLFGSMAGEDAVPAAPAPMDQQVEQPALVLVGGGNPDPLHNFSDIQQAVNDMAKENPDTVPMAEMLGLMAKELRSLTLSQKTTKRENALLLAAARKAKVDEVVSRLSNPMSVRAVKRQAELSCSAPS